MDKYYDYSFIGKLLGDYEVIEISISELSTRTIWTLICNKCYRKHNIIADELMNGDELRCKCGNNYKNIDVQLNENIEDINSKNMVEQVSSKDRQRLRKIRQVIISRCYNHKDKSYHLYGNIGIGIEDSWLKSPVNFINWAISNGYDSNLNLKRKNKDKGYTESNCYWGSGNEVYKNNNDKTLNLEDNTTEVIDTDRIKIDIINNIIDSNRVEEGLNSITKILGKNIRDTSKSIDKLIREDKKVLKGCIKQINTMISRASIYGYMRDKRSRVYSESIMKDMERVVKIIINILNETGDIK